MSESLLKCDQQRLPFRTLISSRFLKLPSSQRVHERRVQVFGLLNKAIYVRGRLRRRKLADLDAHQHRPSGGIILMLQACLTDQAVSSLILGPRGEVLEPILDVLGV